MLQNSIITLDIENTNVKFYKNLPLSTFKECAHQLGLDTYKDIEMIMPFIKNSSMLLDVGSGYGRSIKGILSMGFKGHITALDRVPHLIDHLRDTFPNCTVVQNDITEYKEKEKFDAITWMWSGFLELTSDNQRKVMHTLFDSLKDDGVFVVEVPDIINLYGKFDNEREITFETDWGTLKAFMPLPDEMKLIAENAGFHQLHTQKYESNTGAKRQFFVFKK